MQTPYATYKELVDSSKVTSGLILDRAERIVRESIGEIGEDAGAALITSMVNAQVQLITAHLLAARLEAIGGELMDITLTLSDEK